ncbi:MAG TPA: cysteine synthase family protein [Candidatus Limnocylindrales bacterium]|nr:cysteine synthase family protein [Candidatus Limnocylindrales bacterium]
MNHPARRTVAPSAAEAIGETPLVDLARITRGRSGRILAKLEYLNPGFSKKDRIARQIVDDALESGELRPGQPVVELTSGNTGTGLAIVCAVRGHPFVAVMSEGNSRERARMMRALGAEVVLVPQAAGSLPGQVSGEDLALVEVRARELTVERGAFRADQFVRRSAIRAHELHTGPELWEQAGGEVDAFCEFVGTGSTYAGITLALKARRADIRCYVVEPADAAVLSGAPVTDPNHRIQGGGYSMADLPLLRDVPVDGYLRVTDEEVMAVARWLAREEGLFGGFSSGAVVAAALRLLDGELAGGTIAVVLADSGLKYLSTDLWPDD